MKKSSSLHKKNSQIYSHRCFYLLPRDEMREIHENSRIALQGLLCLLSELKLKRASVTEILRSEDLCNSLAEIAALHGYNKVEDLPKAIKSNVRDLQRMP